MRFDLSLSYPFNFCFYLKDIVNKKPGAHRKFFIRTVLPIRFQMRAHGEVCKNAPENFSSTIFSTFLLKLFLGLTEFVFQSLFDESRHPASGKLPNGDLMAQVVELSPVFLSQLMT
jgi:hypothetical protein